MYFPVLIGVHPMIGCDMHDYLAVPPGIPPPVPMTPHVTVAVLQYLIQDDLVSSDVLTHNLFTVNQYHDIGKLIGHISIPPAPVNGLLLKIIPFSSSKVMFGAPTVLMNNKPMACGLMPMLNCGDPAPLPVGVNIPITNVFVGVSAAALLVQAAVTLVVMGISYLCSKASDHLVKESGIEGFVAQQVANVLVTELITGPTFGSVSNAIQGLANQLLGVPSGDGGGDGGASGEGGGDSGTGTGSEGDGGSSTSSTGGDAGSSTPTGGSNSGGGGAFLGVAPDAPGSQPTDEILDKTRAERFVGELSDETFDLLYPDTMKASEKAIEKEAGAASARKFMDTREPYKWKKEFRELSIKSMAPQIVPILEEFRKEQEENGEGDSVSEDEGERG